MKFLYAAHFDPTLTATTLPHSRFCQLCVCLPPVPCVVCVLSVCVP
jgi:hypothetical protein